MSLKIYTDAATVHEAMPNEVFTNAGAGVDYCDGANKVFHLLAIAPELLAAVYIEERVVDAAATVTFTSGVSSALAGTYGVNALVGRRVIHNGEFRGCVVSNTANTVTLDNAYNSTVADNVTISVYTKQRLTVDYALAGNTITFVTAPPATAFVHAVPLTDSGLAFGGAPGDTVTKSGSVWLKREPGFEYRDIKVFAQDNSVPDHLVTQAGVTAAAGVFSGFAGLAVNHYVGYAVWFNGAFRGVVTANTATTVTIDDAGFTDATPRDFQMWDIGPMLLSLDDVTYKAVIAPADIVTDAPVRIYYKATLKIPNAPMNYPNIIIKATGTEYVA